MNIFNSIMNYRNIAIEGNIGAGKTTLAKMLAEHFNARLILEEFDENPFLPKFYQDPAQYAFPLELFFLAERFKQLRSLSGKGDLFQEAIVSDYLLYKSLLFAKVTLPEEEFKLYQRFFDIINQQMHLPDILIYLHAPISKLQANIKKRNRPYEQSIPDAYLSKIQDTYLDYVKQFPIRTLIFDVSNADFIYRPAHFSQVLEALEKPYRENQHYIEII